MYIVFFFFFFNDPATTEIYTLSLHDALPIYWGLWGLRGCNPVYLRKLTLNCDLTVALKFQISFGEIEMRSEEHTSELQSQFHLVCRLLLEKKKKHNNQHNCNSYELLIT